MKLSRWVLPVIVVSQFFCTSLWFAGNAVLADVIRNFHTGPDYLAHITSAVQLGFISGTLVFALLSISDRFSPSRVFFFCSILAALFNAGVLLQGIQSVHLLLFRFSTGFFLAGVYPVGMKIAADYYRERLGRSLGFLVGALVLGTAFPHLLKSLTMTLSWRYVFYGTSTLSVCGGLLVLLLLPDGPYRKAGGRLNLMAFATGFRQPEFRRVTFGYFGHMWELYTFWTFVPAMLMAYARRFPGSDLNVPLLSFLIIASGGPACVLGGLLSQRLGAKRTATVSLMISGCCCVLSPIFLLSSSIFVVIIFMLVWAMAVIADSPLFSTLVAQNAPEQLRGTSLTIVNCIGFSITIASIQFLNLASGVVSDRYVYTLLSVGPLLGVIALLAKKR